MAVDVQIGERINEDKGMAGDREISYEDIPESVRKLARLIHTMQNSNAVILGIKKCIEHQRQSI